MLTQSQDTDPEAERFMISLFRKASVAKRMSRMRSLSQTVIQVSRRAIMRANPELKGRELEVVIVGHFYGTDLANRLRRYLDKGNP